MTSQDVLVLTDVDMFAMWQDVLVLTDVDMFAM